MNYYVSCPRAKDSLVTGLYPSENLVAAELLRGGFIDFQELRTSEILYDQPVILIVFDFYNIIEDPSQYFEVNMDISLNEFRKVFLIVGKIREGMINVENIEIVRADTPRDFIAWIGTRTEFEANGFNQSSESHR